MQSDLNTLRITTREIEQHSGFEVGDLLIGGIIGGVYRFSRFQQPHRFLQVCFLELITAALIFAFSLPVGLLATRNLMIIHSANGMPQFLATTMGTTLGVWLGWHLYMLVRARSLKTFMHLLDEIDRYNQMLQAAVVLDQLGTIRSTAASPLDRDQVVEALQIIRESLIAGLMTERILRENQRLLACHHDLLVNIENNLAILETLELQHQANEYGNLLNEALQIGMRVQQEMQSLTR